LAKRLSEKEKKEIINYFSNGETVKDLSIRYNCTILTISRNLKKNLGEKKYKEIIEEIKLSFDKTKKKKTSISNQNKNDTSLSLDDENFGEKFFPVNQFMEITPLNYEIDNSPQKDLSSIPISEIEFPNIVYMIVDKKIELETKYLKDYPDWQFLSQEELNRKTIEIHEDLNRAKRSCNKDQKVIKVPNTKVFKIVSQLLLSKGISRIVNGDKLISL
tara:strand:+ start:1256 stop:1906 length:651 start_codon:yes stop_codon:yes gene_type:complete